MWASQLRGSLRAIVSCVCRSLVCHVLYVVRDRHAGRAERFLSLVQWAAPVFRTSGGEGENKNKKIEIFKGPGAEKASA